MPLNLLPTSPPLSPAGGLSLSALPPAPIPGLYVHVPFCFHKCHYCDFYSITRQTPERMAAFVDRLLAEADLWVKGRGSEDPIRTVFFGGGTPSLLPREEMSRLIAGLRARLNLSQVQEWTIECNPATVDLPYLQSLRDQGIDRLSFGAQSFNTDDLKALERHHDPDDVPRSLDLARQAGFGRLNLDLIFGVPGQSLDSWNTTLQAALACNTTHVSAYLLTYEPNTPMAVKKRLGQLIPAEESLELQMLAHTREVLRAHNLPPYEISNYAVPGQECQHNLMYWHGENYIGLGPSAASHVEGHRFKNRPHLREWEQAIDAGQLPLFEHEHLDSPHRAAELGYLMSRLARGINWSYFHAQTKLHGPTFFASAIDKLLPLGLIEVDDEALRLTEKGIPLADAIATELLL